EEVDALLDMAHEVAPGHLGVFAEHVGEVLARDPVVCVRDEPGIRSARLGQTGVVLVVLEVLGDALERLPAWGERARGPPGGRQRTGAVRTTPLVREARRKPRGRDRRRAGARRAPFRGPTPGPSSAPAFGDRPGAAAHGEGDPRLRAGIRCDAARTARAARPAPLAPAARRSRRRPDGGARLLR